MKFRDIIEAPLGLAYDMLDAPILTLSIFVGISVAGVTGTGLYLARNDSKSTIQNTYKCIIEERINAPSDSPKSRLEEKTILVECSKVR